MSSELSFNFRDEAVRVFIAEDQKELFHGADVCRALGRSDNFARTIKTFVKDKWWIEYPNPKGGKPILCLFEPGLYQLATNPIFDSDFASQFQDLVFEEVLPKLRADGGYIMPTVSDEQYKVLQANLDNANKESAYLKELAKLNRLNGILEACTQMHQAITNWDFRLNFAHQRKWYLATQDFWFQKTFEAREAFSKQEKIVNCAKQNLSLTDGSKVSS